MEVSFIIQFASALFLGMLIGAERERVQQKKHFQDFAGIRSFIFISLVGFISAYITQTVTVWFLLVSYTLFFVLIISTYLYNAFQLQREGMTTELAAVLTFLIGFLCLVNTPLAVVLGILVTLLLTLKDFSHTLLQHVNDTEFYSTIKFAIISFIVLPFLPTYAVDPWGIFKPYATWQIVVFISGVSFLGYILTRVIGLDRGSRYTALFGGIASSTAVNAAYAAESKLVQKNVSDTTSLVSGTLLATGVSFSRILFAVYITNSAFFFHTWIPVSVIAGSLIIASFVIRHFYHKQKHILTSFKLESPFKLKTAFEFALALTVILVLAELGKYYLGDAGLYITAMLSGMAKGDAIAIAVATMTLEGKISYDVATKAFLLSIATSFVAKYFIAKLAGTKRYMRMFGLSLIVTEIIAIGLFLFY